MKKIVTNYGVMYLKRDGSVYDSKRKFFTRSSIGEKETETYLKSFDTLTDFVNSFGTLSNPLLSGFYYGRSIEELLSVINDRITENNKNEGLNDALMDMEFMEKNNYYINVIGDGYFWPYESGLGNVVD